jgi:peptide/nickel transport system substrate-binding protein
MRLKRALVVIAAVGLIATACGDDKGAEPNTSTTAGGATSTTAATATTKTPVTGGTLTFGSYSKISGLDPIVGLGQGTSGGIPMAALYDSIVRFNQTTNKYEMRTAESVTPSADSLEWTVKLKAGIKFTDGTDYDAEAVRFGMNRHRVGTGIPATECAQWYACPRTGVSSSAYMSLVKDIVVVDKLTLKFTLTEPYTAFYYNLSAEAAMIPSPTAIKKACVDPTKAANTCPFNLAPVGAGAFMVSSYKPDDSINMVRNPTFFGGQVYLDGINFLDSGDTGGLATLEKLKTGTIGAAFLRDPAAVAGAKDAKFQGFSTLEQNGAIVLLNMGANVNCAGGKPEPLCVGKPDGPTVSTPQTKELKVRQAIAAAIDPKVLNDRAYNGKLLLGSQLLQSSFPWDPGVPGPVFNLDNAKKLTTEAKATGWNGNLRLVFVNSELSKNSGLAIQTMLNAAGMNATLETYDSTAQQGIVITTKEFDVATWGMALSGDDGAVWALDQNLKSTGTSNRVGFKSTIVDQALKDIRAAKTDADKKAGFKKIAEEVNAQLPFVTYGAIEEYNTYTPKLQGAVGGNRAYIFFDKAFLEK